MTAPAYTRQLVARRNSGTSTDSVFIAVGWPSPWLREFVERSPLTRNAFILAAPEPKVYEYAATIGLSVCIWYERESDAPRAAAIAAHIMAANPLRLFTLNATTGETQFYRVAADRRAAA
jgi:hypothetical protein